MVYCACMTHVHGVCTGWHTCGGQRTIWGTASLLPSLCERSQGSDSGNDMNFAEQVPLLLNHLTSPKVFGFDFK